MRQHFHLLDGLRGYAALVVVLHHMMVPFRYTLPVGGGLLAVDFFFLMSGLVIATSYEKRLQDGSVSFGDFVQRRLLRLYPAFLVGAGIAIGLMVLRGMTGADGADPGYSASAAMSLLLMAPEVVYRTGSAFPINSPAWSLSFEFWGNVLYALFVFRLGTRSLAAVVVLALATYVWGVALHGDQNLGMGYDNYSYAFGFARFWFPFGAGILIWRLRSRLPDFGQAGWAIVIFAMLFPALPNDPWLRMGWIAIVFPLCVIAAMRLQVSAKVARLCTWLGLMSYPIYIIHDPILKLVFTVAARIIGKGAWINPVVGLVALVVIFAMTLLTAYVLEPALRGLMLSGTERLRTRRQTLSLK